MSQSSSRVLGQLLLGAGVIASGELLAALQEQARTRERLGEILVRRGVDPEHVARALALQLRLPYLPAPLRPQPEAVRTVQREVARRLRLVPVALEERALRVAMADPLDGAAVDDLQFRTGRRVETAVAAPAAVQEALDAAYPQPAAVQPSPPRGPRSGRPGQDEDVGDVGALLRASEAAPTVATVDLLLERAITAGASDVHIEPGEAVLGVRARVDGVLRQIHELPATMGAAVVSRIKIMANMDIAVRRRPQDGRTAVEVAGREWGLRVSTLPCEWGEKVVLRLLDSAQTALSLDQLGLGGVMHARLLHLLQRGHGVILVTGPTGSGKTTTLYAALSSLDRERRNVVTLEDPVEYRLPGLTQVQVHARAGLTFAAALRAVLRQDPDVIMVGEVRDRETAEIAMAAAFTGHLVLSTLHTNDAVSAVTRLADMGVASYMIAGGLIGVVAQRLARRLCPACRVERAGTPVGSPAAAVATPGAATERAAFDSTADFGGPLFDSVGCDRCSGEGFRGRVGVYELVCVDARLRQLILDRAPADELRRAARAAGARSLAQDAWSKVREGLTTTAEVLPLLALLQDEG